MKAETPEPLDSGPLSPALRPVAVGTAVYSNDNPVEQLYGAKEMPGFGAVVAIPRQPLLVAGRYRVDLQVSGHDYKWSSAAEPAKQQSASSR